MPCCARVLREIQEIVGKLEDEIPSDPNKMRMALPKLLEAAGKQGKMVIVLDGLNQLESKLSDLAWLPLALPADVKLVVSFKRGEPQAESYFEQLQAGGQRHLGGGASLSRAWQDRAQARAGVSLAIPEGAGRAPLWRRLIRSKAPATRCT